MESNIKMCYKIFSTKLYCVIWEHDQPGKPVLFLEISVHLVRFNILTVVIKILWFGKWHILVQWICTGVSDNPAASTTRVDE